MENLNPRDLLASLAELMDSHVFNQFIGAWIRPEHLDAVFYRGSNYEIYLIFFRAYNRPESIPNRNEVLQVTNRMLVAIGHHERGAVLPTEYFLSRMTSRVFEVLYIINRTGGNVRMMQYRDLLEARLHDEDIPGDSQCNFYLSFFTSFITIVPDESNLHANLLEICEMLTNYYVSSRRFVVSIAECDIAVPGFNAISELANRREHIAWDGMGARNGLNVRANVYVLCPVTTLMASFRNAIRIASVEGRITQAVATTWWRRYSSIADSLFNPNNIRYQLSCIMRAIERRVPIVVDGRYRAEDVPAINAEIVIDQNRNALGIMRRANPVEVEEVKDNEVQDLLARPDEVEELRRFLAQPVLPVIGHRAPLQERPENQLPQEYRVEQLFQRILPMPLPPIRGPDQPPRNFNVIGPIYLNGVQQQPEIFNLPPIEAPWEHPYANPDGMEQAARDRLRNQLPAHVYDGMRLGFINPSHSDGYKIANQSRIITFNRSDRMPLRELDEIRDSGRLGAFMNEERLPSGEIVYSTTAAELTRLVARFRGMHTGTINPNPRRRFINENPDYICRVLPEGCTLSFPGLTGSALQRFLGTMFVSEYSPRIVYRVEIARLIDENNRVITVPQLSGVDQQQASNAPVVETGVCNERHMTLNANPNGTSPYSFRTLDFSLYRVIPRDEAILLGADPNQDIILPGDYAHGQRLVARQEDVDMADQAGRLPIAVHEDFPEVVDESSDSSVYEVPAWNSSGEESEYVPSENELADDEALGSDQDL